LGKPSVLLPKVAGTAIAPAAAPVTTKKGGYAAMLQRAAQTQQAKPAVPPVKHEVTKILTKKEREALRAEQMAIAKGKKPAAPAGRTTGIKNEINKEKKKPVDLGYQGTARPAKKPIEIGYKGTARPTSTPAGPAGRPSGPGRAKPKSGQGRYTGYAAWSDDDGMEEEGEEEEEDYDSAASSDMEADAWDMENEEELALKAAKKEDALALKEENEAKRLKEERKKKLMALNKAAAAKRKY
jgi:hypothetical protein